MKRTGIADSPLHGGKAPRWLFQRMTGLARQIIIAMVQEFGTRELLHRLSDPHWFQALGSVLGFDWHSSGLTTTACGAIKEGIRGLEEDLGFFVAGGKGKAALRTPDNILGFGEALSIDPEGLVYASRMSAKVDNAGLQDGYAIYHHSFFFTADGNWAVVQQGMNKTNRYARRYHWLGESICDFTCEPHAAVCGGRGQKDVLNMVAEEGEEARKASAVIGCESPDTLIKELKKVQTLKLPPRHHILAKDLHPDRLYKTFLAAYEAQPGNFENLIGLRGVGPKSIRALALLSELIYGASVSFRDPARFSFAHGGKDGHPYPVDRQSYDRSIEILKQAVESAKIGDRQKMEAIKRLKGIEGRKGGRRRKG
ncbi:MAG: DUF763 domain-containing protein [Deltaproteobacteria bacterium]|nr:DUF763 domain-containing protein [Deltaproteobacteria bacterium]MBW1796316.1 DUF763 domain-containing protein [Deltaproteobacteria bacterium]